jgi:uncharacterized membrane-anchored protein
MTEKTGKLQMWAYSLIIAIVAWVVTIAGYFIDNTNVLFSATLVIAIAGTVIGAIQYLLTKRA